MLQLSYVCVGSTPRLQAVVGRQLVSLRSVEFLFMVVLNNFIHGQAEQLLFVLRNVWLKIFVILKLDAFLMM